MNFFKNSNKVLIFLFIMYSMLIALLAVYLRNSRMFNDDKLKISEFVAASFAMASVFVGVTAAILSYKSLRFAQKAEEGQLYIKMMERYSSVEMLNSLQKLGKFGADNKNNLEEAFRKWSSDLSSGDTEAKQIEQARHKIKYFYRDLMQLYQAGYFSKELTKRILNPGGRLLFKNLVLPMEKYRNPFQFEGEFKPFDIFNNELNYEQQLALAGAKKTRTACLIPARYNATRYPGKLLGMLKKEPGISKSVIRATYDNISSMDLFDYVAVVTNSKIIKDEIQTYGGNVIHIEKEYESGTDRIADALGIIDADIIVNVQGDEPFVKKKLLEDLIETVSIQTNDLMVGSLMRLMDNKNDIISSDFVKVVCDKNDFALYFSRNVIPFQKKPECEPSYYEHVGVYIFTRKALLKFPQLNSTPLEQIESVECLRYLENGIPIKMLKTTEHILEIDTEADLALANSLIAEGKLNLI